MMLFLKKMSGEFFSEKKSLRIQIGYLVIKMKKIMQLDKVIPKLKDKIDFNITDCD